jgi:hypothetical protein
MKVSGTAGLHKNSVSHWSDLQAVHNVIFVASSKGHGKNKRRTKAKVINQSMNEKQQGRNSQRRKIHSLASGFPKDFLKLGLAYRFISKNPRFLLFTNIGRLFSSRFDF